MTLYCTRVEQNAMKYRPWVFETKRFLPRALVVVGR